MARLKYFDKSRWQLDRERFQLADQKPSPADSDMSIRQTIVNIFNKLDTDDQCVRRQVEQEWNQLAGSVIARHARPIRFDRKMLIVAVDSAVWLNELIRYERAAILANLQKRFGADRIKAIRFQADAGLTLSQSARLKTTSQS